jgi:hypothetical protein
MDVVERIRPIILELERTHSSVLVISHRAVLRVIFAYFTGIDDMQQLPSLNPEEVLSGSGPSKITLLRPGAYGCEVEHLAIFDHQRPVGEPSTPHERESPSASTTAGAPGERLRWDLKQALSQPYSQSEVNNDELKSEEAVSPPKHRRGESIGGS